MKEFLKGLDMVCHEDISLCFSNLWLYHRRKVTVTRATKYSYINDSTVNFLVVLWFSLHQLVFKFSYVAIQSKFSSLTLKKNPSSWGTDQFSHCSLQLQSSKKAAPVATKCQFWLNRFYLPPDFLPIQSSVLCSYLIFDIMVFLPFTDF